MVFFLPPLETSSILRAVFVVLVNVLFVDCWIRSKRTRRQALLELVGLVRILENESVQEAVAADLELGLAGLAAALDAGGYSPVSLFCLVEFLIS
jgi:hypothetical protein